VTIGSLGEFGLIAAITALLPRDGRTLVGVGDDAAVLAVPDGRVVATTDMLVEGRHFRRDWSSGADIGAKAAAQNLADVAAMGADPIALLVGFAAPGDVPAGWARDLVAGIAQECSRAGATVAGGDVSSAGTVVLGITALGTMAGRDPVTRAGARPGDLLAVAGVLGHSAAGFALLEAGLTEPASLVAAHRRPRPPYRAGPEAAALGATAMIDISDGLIADLGHVAEASGVRISIETALVPPDPTLAAAASALASVASAAAAPSAGTAPAPAPAAPAPAPAASGSRLPRPLDWLLTGGEDHALAATFPPGTPLPSQWSVIGRVEDGRGILVDGKTFQGSAGWKHFW